MSRGNSLYPSNETVPYVSSFKYLGIKFLVKKSLTIDVPFIKRKFYAACSSILMGSKTTCEIVQVQLAKSFCLPLLTYLVGALNISQSKVRELGVCWNDAFRRIIDLNRWESVKLIRYFCGALDFKHYYDIQRWRFVSNIGTKVAYWYLNRFFCG